MSQIAPGPRGLPLLGSALDFRRDVLGLMLENVRRHGDIVRFHIGPFVTHLVNDPESIERVLVTNQQNYNKATRSSAKIRSICGESLLTSNDEAWRSQRHLMQPIFHRRSVATFAAKMTQAIATTLERWQPHSKNGQPLDIASEMMRLTYTIVGRALLGVDLSNDADVVERAMAEMLSHSYRRWGRMFDVPDWLPSPGNLRFQKALRSVDEIVYRIIATHRENPAKHKDLLSMLLAARDEVTGEGLNDQQLRNQTVTFLLAGHETTANALTWTFYLLSQHPSIVRELQTEIATVLGDRVPTLEDLPRLKLTTMVIQESMRLYPPIWAMERQAIQDDVLGGYQIRAGSSVVISPYVLHRDPKFWRDPERFDPTRFIEPQRVGYMPFGAGPRLCIGSEFAMLEARLIVAMVVREFHLELVPGHRVEPLPGITLRTRYGLPMVIRKQTS
ncbi:MAG: cytochrome P450 [Verrucomicrobiae bacterium]|nr:cytochrome P450 [Verrucomicrobiae bacterium]